jgi:hypothetical protein
MQDVAVGRASSYNPHAVPMAQAHLGILLMAEDPGRAQKLLQAAAESRISVLASQASEVTRDLKRELGDAAAAAAAYERAISLSDPYWSNLARLDLSGLLMAHDHAPERY